MHHVPSFFGTKTIGDPQGKEDGLMIPLFKKSWICVLIYALSITDILYMPMLGRGQYCCNYILWWIPLLEGNPFGS